MIASGNAPVLEGNKIALSIPSGKARCADSLQQLSNGKSRCVGGFRHGISRCRRRLRRDARCRLAASTSKTSSSRVARNSSGSAPILTWRSSGLRRDNAIKLTSVVARTPNSEALLNTVYAKLLDLLFRPVEEAPPPKQEMGLLDAIGSAIGLGLGGGSAGIGLTASYRLKDMQSSGHTILNFNHQSQVTRHALITFNVGDLFKTLRPKPRLFQGDQSRRPDLLTA